MTSPQGPSGEKQPHVAAATPAPPDSDTPNATHEQVAETVRQEAHAIGEQAREAAHDVKHEAREAAAEAKEHIRATASEQKDAAAERMGGFAHALRSASDDLRQHGQGRAAEYIEQAAGGLERASSAMRQRDLDDLIGTVEDFARRQPVAFLGGAVVAGFGLARLVKSSADRRRNTAAGAVPGQGEQP